MPFRSLLLAAPVLIGFTSSQAGAQTLINGAANSGSISQAFEVDTYTFAATAGDSVQLSMADLNGATLSPQMDVFQPSGSLLLSSWSPSVAKLEFVVPTTGTYSLAVKDNSVIGGFYTGPYDVHFVLAPGANEHGVLPNGGVVTEAIDLGDLDSYTFDANQGEGIMLRMTDTGDTSLWPHLDVYQPDGSLIASDGHTSTASLSFSAPATGTYTLVAKDDSEGGGADTGAYSIQYTRAPGANENGALVNGGSVSGVLDSGDLDSFTFAASQGDSLQLTLVNQGTPTTNVSFNVYRPDGTLVMNAASTTVATGKLSVPSTGTYTLVVSDKWLVGGGSYELFFVRAPGANEHGVLPSGGAVTEALDIGDLDSYTFDANQGEGIRLRISKTSGSAAFRPTVEVYLPDGSYFGESSPGDYGSVADIEFAAPSQGTYTVVAREKVFGASGDTGTYIMHFVHAPGANEHGPLPNGGMISGFIDQGDLDSFTFDANSGEGIQLRLGLSGQGSLSPQIDVYRPDGTLLVSTWSHLVSPLAFAAPATGTYTVVVSDSDAWYYQSEMDDTGPYQIHFTRAPGANEGGLILDGSTTNASLSSGDLDSFTFAGQAGTSPLITVTKLSSFLFIPRVTLYDPLGKFLGAASSNQVATLLTSLPTTGTYTVVVADGSSDSIYAGSYAIKLDSTGVSPSLSPNAYLPAELAFDPILTDIGGDPNLGPRIGNPAEPFNFSIDCGGAETASIYLIQVWSQAASAPQLLPEGLLHLGGIQLAEVAGLHSQSIESWLPTPAGLVMAADPALVGVTYTVQGFCGGQGASGRISNAITQVISN